MSIIQLREANCKGCYKCIRNCELKSISFKKDQARIIDNDCILCGKCTLICPQNAKEIQSDIPRIRETMAANVPLYASVAPSFMAAFPGVSFAQLSAGLKALGFAGAEETAIGAQAVSHQYETLMALGNMPNIITTCCPSINMLVEKYYPELTPFLAPVVAPATAHARMLRAAHPEAKVVFVGPCISKKQEALDGNDIFAVLMFEELTHWLEAQQITLGENDPASAGMKETIARLYPTPSGIIKTIPREKRGGYRCTAIDGLDRCIEMLNNLRDHPEIRGFFLEMSSCANSCIGGPGLHYKNAPFLLVKEDITSALQEKSDAPSTEGSAVPMRVVYNHSRVREHMPDEETIKGILASIGKTDESAMLNCGACGYPTCREKAIAVAQGKAELHMCLPYMREKAESLSNVIIESTPNALILIDEEGNILQYNKAAQEIYGIAEERGKGFPVALYVPVEEVEQVRATGEPMPDVRQTTLEGKRIVLQTIMPAPNNDVLIVARDVTDQENAHKEMEQLRRETLETTQQVIDKQMRVAQEIASLLGETTGESKAALTKLKKSIMKGDTL